MNLLLRSPKTTKIKALAEPQPEPQPTPLVDTVESVTQEIAAYESDLTLLRAELSDINENIRNIARLQPESVRELSVRRVEINDLLSAESSVKAGLNERLRLAKIEALTEKYSASFASWLVWNAEKDILKQAVTEAEAKLKAAHEAIKDHERKNFHTGEMAAAEWALRRETQNEGVVAEIVKKTEEIAAKFRSERE